MTLLILRHVTTRVLIAIPLLLAVTLGTFLMLYSIGDPAAALAGEGATNAQIQEIRVAYGLDKPVLQQYATWLGNTLSGDLGSSMANKGSVSELVGDYLPPTLMLSAYAMLIATVTAVIMGSVVGSRPGGITDKIMQGISLLGVAIPNFLLALLLILIFAIQFQFLPPGGYRTPESVGLAETLKYLTLPALSLFAWWLKVILPGVDAGFAVQAPRWPHRPHRPRPARSSSGTWPAMRRPRWSRSSALRSASSSPEPCSSKSSSPSPASAR